MVRLAADSDSGEWDPLFQCRVPVHWQTINMNGESMAGAMAMAMAMSSVRRQMTGSHARFCCEIKRNPLTKRVTCRRLNDKELLTLMSFACVAQAESSTQPAGLSSLCQLIIIVNKTVAHVESCLKCMLSLSLRPCCCCC